MLNELLDIFFHLDVHLKDWAQTMGGWLYLLLFAILFCETGLVVMPFLPGDSLLFAVGAIAAVGGIDPWTITALLCIAAVLGDAVNYSIGYRLGPRVFSREDSWLLNKKHLVRTQRFYEMHGGKTIFLARFMPIIRTFAPFVAGIGRMRYRRFAVFNVTGGTAWVICFILAGYWFGNRPLVQRNFHLVIAAIVLISVIPVGIEYLRARAEARRNSATEIGAPSKE